MLPYAELTIAGPGLRHREDGSLVVPASWSGPGVRVTGFVEDLEDLYGATIGMLAPVVGGSGVRMKLLETMSAGMPTVTTSDGAAGLGVEDGREVLIADRPTEFAERVVRLVRDAPLRDRLRAAGYAFLDARHSERVAVERLRRALGLG
jgi:glycosyltransferase involved in cell wall biosynthesis